MKYFITLSSVVACLVSSVTPQGTPVLTSTATDRNLLGTNVSFRCQYTSVNTEIGNSVEFQHKLHGTFLSIVSRVFYPISPPVWNNPGVESRSDMTVTDNPTAPYGTLTMSRLVCTDEREYRCIFTVRIPGGVNDTVSSPVDFKVYGKAQKPVLTYNPNTIVENESVTFTCNGNVGRPRGSLKMSLHDTSNALQSVVLQVQDKGIIEATDTCTYESTVEVTYTFTANQKTMVVICEVEQDYVDAENKQQRTETLNVAYSPRDTRIHMGQSNPAGSQEEVIEGSDIQLRCTTDSNPPATFQWSYRRDGDNETVEHAPGNDVLQLNPIRMDQAGDYHCNATLVINDITYFDQQSIRLIVNEKRSTLVLSTTLYPTVRTTGNINADPSPQAGPGPEPQTFESPAVSSYETMSTVTNTVQGNTLDPHYTELSMNTQGPDYQKVSRPGKHYEKLQLEPVGGVYENTRDEHTYEGQLSLPHNDIESYEKLESAGDDYENTAEEHVYEEPIM